MYVIWLFDVSAASFLLDLQYSCGVWYVLMVLYGKGIVKERVTCRKVNNTLDSGDNCTLIMLTFCSLKLNRIC